MKKYASYIFVFISVLFFSCSKNPIPKDIRMIMSQAGDNKAEIQKLIDYYSATENDSVKLKAAYFLIRNMYGLISLDSLSVSQNSIYFEAIEHETKKKGARLHNDSIYYIIDSVNAELNITPEYRLPKYNADLKILPSSSLIENIDLSFHAWQTFPWSRHIPFEEFCEYILPYRCSETYSLQAKDFFLRRYGWIADTLSTCTNPFEVARHIIADIDSWFIEDPTLMAKFPYLNYSTFSDFLRGKVVACKNITETKVTALRAMGIPTAYDFLLNWANSNSSHFWFKIIDDKNDTLQSKLSNVQREIDTQYIMTGSSYAIYPRLEGIPKDVNLYFNRTVSKVYRKSFGTHEFAFTTKEIKNIPPVFRNNRLTDVTSHYVECMTLTYELQQKYKSAIICLLCFDNIQWTVQSMGKINKKDNTVFFEDIGKNIVYLPAIYESGEYVYIDSPFLLDNEGIIQSLQDNGHAQSITLHSKYPFRSEIELWFSFMTGGKFKVANRKDLSDSKTIHVIDTVPFYEQAKKIGLNGKYKYLIYDYSDIVNFRYDVGDIDCSIKKTDCNFIGNQGVYGHTVKEAFDDDRLSYFSHNDAFPEKYIGIELDEPATIDQIRYTPRNDDNGINMHESYELFYWDDGWRSLGVKTSTANNITFHNVPCNALFLLKNTKGGTENRIFTYSEDKQHFW